MALVINDLMTVIGKYVKTINTWNTLLSTTLEAQKDEIYTVLDAEDLQDLYIDLPAQFEGFKSAVSSWISTVIGEVEDILTDETYVLEELPIVSSDVTTVLNAIFDQMVTDSDSIKASIVTLGGADSDTAKFSITRADSGDIVVPPTVFVSRTLDGLNDPSSLVDAHTSYVNQESQLAMSCDVIAKVTSQTEGSETVQLFADSPSQASYTGDAESPGVGPTLTNAEVANLIPNNYDFSEWSGDNPTGWTVTGGVAGTDWDDVSGTGEGPLRIFTAGTYVKQQITGLTRRQNYLFAASCFYTGSDPSAASAKFRVENVDGVTVHKNFGTFTVTDVDGDPEDVFFYAYGFFVPDDLINLNDIYLTLEHDAESHAAHELHVHKMIAVPATYFNGLGFGFWKPVNSSTSVLGNAVGRSAVAVTLPVGRYNSLAVVNGNQGVFQTFFRRAFNIQLPTDGSGSETIADTLAT